MVFDYASISGAASRQILDKGRTISILYKTEGTYDPNADAIYGDSSQIVMVNAIVTSFSKRNIEAGLVEMNDILAIISASGVQKPTTNDKIIDGDEYSIIGVSEIKPGSTPILYKLQIRK